MCRSSQACHECGQARIWRMLQGTRVWEGAFIGTSAPTCSHQMSCMLTVLPVAGGSCQSFAMVPGAWLHTGPLKGMPAIFGHAACYHYHLVYICVV